MATTSFAAVLALTVNMLLNRRSSFEEEEEVVVVFMTIAFVRTLEEEDVDDKNDLILVVAVKW